MYMTDSGSFYSKQRYAKFFIATYSRLNRIKVVHSKAQTHSRLNAKKQSNTRLKNLRGPQKYFDFWGEGKSKR